MISRLFALFGLLAVVPTAVVLVPTPAVAEEASEDPTDPGFRFYEEAALKILKSAGNKVWEAAEYAKRGNMFQFATQQAERAIEFDPNHEEAREYLGYVKKSKKWVLDPDEAAKVKRQNVRAGSSRGAQMSEEAFAEMQEKWKEKHLAAANKFVAKKYAKLGAACDAKGFALQARKGYEQAMRLDSNNKAARKGLGYKKFGKVWLTKKQDDARKKAAIPEVHDEDSEWDRLLSTKLNKVRSEHFRMESPFPLAELKEYCTTAETAYAYYLSDLGLDPTRDVFRGRRAMFCLMETDDQWNTWVDTYASNDPEFTRKMSGTSNSSGLHAGKRNKKGHGPTTRKDGVVHTTIHFLNHFVFRTDQFAWLNEGLSYYYTVKVQESTLTHCVAKKAAKYGGQKAMGGYKDWKKSENWKPNLKEWVNSKSDEALRSLVNKPLAKLEFEATVKSWGVITWMMDTDRDSFIRLLKALQENPSDQEEVIQKIYKKGLEELDEEWRRYVSRNF